MRKSFSSRYGSGERVILPSLSILRINSYVPSVDFQVPTSSEYLGLPSGFCFDLQLIENNNINNNAIKDTILALDLTNEFTVIFVIFHFLPPLI